MQNSVLETKIKQLPRKPGVYLFKNENEKIIYIGKAKQLKARVGSYFSKSITLGTKTQALISRIKDIDYIETQNELEALILEAELIKKHKPKYNVLLKDDKSHLYIVIRNDVFDIKGKEKKIPKIITCRKTDLQKKDIYFGPYPDGNTARQIVKIIRKIFPFRDCSVSKFKKYQKLGKPCLYGHLNICPAPCVNQKKEHFDNYNKNIKRIRKFLSGGSSKILEEFEKEMQKASKKQEYEKAAYYKNIIDQFNYVRASYKGVQKYIENPNLVEDLAEQALTDLKDNINILNKSPKRIECYDISTISGKSAVGSMVVAINGQIDKSEYKRFKIKTKDTPDDYHMMQEVLKRRLKRIKSNAKNIKKWGTPDLLVMDGGKGQVSIVLQVLEELKLDIPVVGLAKKKETIIFFNKSKFSEINLSQRSEGLKLLIRLRDEAHRFAQSYHHYLRLKEFKI